MKSKHKDFIATYQDVYPDGYCQHLISQFDLLESNGAGANRLKGENAQRHEKNDHQIALSLKGHNTENFDGNSVTNVFFNGLQKCYEEYISNFSILTAGKIRASSVKMQRTAPGGGYHIWHCEQNSNEQASRVLVYMLYLNTLKLEEAGETEFLYQQTRISPQENTMIIWPAAFTHAHRGNTVFGNTSKYIVTGWFHYD
jgi:hypothetical protein